MVIVGIRRSHQVVGIPVVFVQVVPVLGSQLVIAPIQPFECHFGLVDLVPPSIEGFTGNAVWDNPVHAQIVITGRGDGHVLKGTELGQRFE